MKTQVSVLVLIAALAGSASAAPQAFDFKDAKGVNNAQFKLDAPLEAITGHANGISGTVTFDPAKPADTKGKIVVASQSLSVPNSMMKDHLHSEKWLDVAKHPEITFEAKELKNVKTQGDVTTADAAGTFTLKGVSKDISIPVKLTYLKDKLSARLPSLKGDLLVVRSTFSIKRSDFNIQAGQSEDKVSDEIELTLAIAGASAK
ncbi:MAG: YceI family protein [Akkermansiaceae bacterium]|nr:YceI family protein [Verrucomicrobiales bacterium]